MSTEFDVGHTGARCEVEDGGLAKPLESPKLASARDAIQTVK